MTAAIYVAGAVLGGCVVWLVLASTGLGRTDLDVSWRRVWLPVLASTAAAATFLILRFVEAESPVSPAVLTRGWFGLFLIMSAVFAAATAVLMTIASRVRLWRGQRGQQSPAG